MSWLRRLAVLCLFSGTPLFGEGQEGEPFVVGFLVGEGVRGSELTGPFDVLHQIRFHAEPGTRLLTIAGSRDEISTFEGLRIIPDSDFESAPELDVIVVPGRERYSGESFDEPELIRFLEKRAPRAQFVLSLGDAAFVLASAGLLEGRTVTTRPDRIQLLRTRFSGARVIDGLSFTVDGKLITSAGGARSREAALYLVERLFGELPAIAAARGLVSDWSLDGIPHYVVLSGQVHSYDAGDMIDPEVEVEDADGVVHTLLSLRGEEDLVIVLCLFGGGGDREGFHRAGIWCEDSMNELPLLRHTQIRFQERSVAFLPVACPPALDEVQFGYPNGCFESSSADYAAARARFVTATQEAIDSGVIPFNEVYYDPSLRLMQRPVSAELTQASAGEKRPAWVGRFRARDEYQQYGLPTIWILSREGRVLMPPLRGNRYEKNISLRYTARELHAAIERALEIVGG